MQHTTVKLHGISFATPAPCKRHVRNLLPPFIPAYLALGHPTVQAHAVQTCAVQAYAVEAFAVQAHAEEAFAIQTCAVWHPPRSV